MGEFESRLEIIAAIDSVKFEHGTTNLADALA